MDQGQLRAAEAAEQRRGELGLTQSETGVTAKWWREFVSGKKWPGVRTRSRIEAHLDWHIGALDRIAKGQSSPRHEAIEGKGPSQYGSQDEAEAMLGRLMLRAEGTKRLVLALREAFDRQSEADVDRLIKELDEYLKGPE